MISLTLLEMITLALATYTTAHLLVHEDAPFRLMARIREKTTIGGALNCMRCTGFWCAVVWFIIWQTPLAPVTYPFAIVGLMLMAASYSGVNHL